MTQINTAAVSFDVKKANAYIPYILLIGVAIATANYFMYAELNWFQWLIRSCSTCFLIGYVLVSIAANKTWFEHHIKSGWKLYLLLSVAFILLGILASEVEQLINALIFDNKTYQAFAAGNIYIFNGIISLAMGFSFFLNVRFFPNQKEDPSMKQEHVLSNQAESITTQEAFDPISKIPVKQKDGILLIPVQDIVYFEAYDNYSFVFDKEGKKMLCDYSLIFLEKRLGKNFLRVHRKYIVHTSHIKQIKPHLNGRFLIYFDVGGMEAITSSKGYASNMRKLIKIE